MVCLIWRTDRHNTSCIDRFDPRLENIAKPCLANTLSRISEIKVLALYLQKI